MPSCKEFLSFFLTNANPRENVTKPKNKTKGMTRARASASVNAALGRSVLAVAVGNPTPIQHVIHVPVAYFQRQSPSLYFEDFTYGLWSSFGSITTRARLGCCRRLSGERSGGWVPIKGEIGKQPPLKVCINIIQSDGPTTSEMRLEIEEEARQTERL